MKDRSRQWGIDIARVISTYGIVFIHSGGYAPYDSLSTHTQELFNFALPFFLAVSFYLLSISEKESRLKSFKLIFLRFNRLLIPYFVWSLIYLTARVVKAFITHKFVDLEYFFQEPFSILFFGSSAVHLYFLPLLFAGNLFAILISRFKTNFKTSVILFFASLAIYDLILQIYASFSMELVKFYGVFYSLQTSSLLPFLKFILVQAWFVIICLPYIFFARSILAWKNEHLSQLKISKTYYLFYFLIVFCFLISTTLGRRFMPSLFNEPVWGCLLLLIALASPSLSLNTFFKKILLDLSKASFGIYLIHHLVINSSQLLITNIKPTLMSEISILSLICFSVLGFLISWLVVRIFTNRDITFVKQ